MARLCSILGVTTFIRAIGDVEEQEQLAKEEQEMQEALTKFAEVDASQLWQDDNHTIPDPTRLPGDQNVHEELGDTGVVVSRQSAAQANAASPNLEAKTTKKSSKPVYKSKIISSPLIVSEEESINAARTSDSVTALPHKKRKLELDSNTSRQASSSNLPRKKKKKKPKNEIDALFAGL